LVTFAEGAPHWAPPQASPTLIWALHHHQGCRGQFLRAQHSTIPWPAPSIQCGPPSTILSTIVGHIRHCRTTHTNRVKPNCMEHATTDQIMDTQIKNTHQQRIQLYRVVKVGQLLHQGKWLTRDQVQQKFPHLMEALTQWGPLLPKGGGLIQVDIGGHPPIPSTSQIKP
jgi:hypothetical protein